MSTLADQRPDQRPGGPPAGRPAGRGGRRRAGAALLTGALLLSGGALASADTLVPDRTSTTWLQDVGLARSGRSEKSRAVPVPAATTRLGCPAAPSTVTAEGTDAQFQAQPVTTTSRVRAAADGATAAQLSLQGPGGAAVGPAGADPVATGGLRLVEGDGTAPVQVVGVPAAPGAAAAASAVQSAVTTAGDLRGVSAGACTPPSAHAWLVGGGAEVGRSTRLVLANPGTTPAVADLTLLTGTGPQVPRAGQGVLVPAGEVVELLVEALVAVEPTLAVGVSATGGLVHASLVDTAVDGLTPAGVEAVTPTEAATRHVLPGLPAGADRAQGADRAVLRVAVPGEGSAVVGWRVEGTDGPVAGSEPAAATVRGGSVADLPLTSADGSPVEGPATLVVESDVPVVVSVEVSRPAGADPGAPVDRAWVAPAARLGGSALMALPGGPVAAELVLSAGDPTSGDPPASPSGETAVDTSSVTVVPVSADGTNGAPVAVEVTAGTTSVVGAGVLAGAVAVRLEVGAGGVHAAAVLTASSDPAATAATTAAADLLSVVAVPAPATAPGVVHVSRAPAGAWP